MVADLLLERGDCILVEDYTYFYMVDSVLPIKGYNAVAMRMDDQGICPVNLRKVLLLSALLIAQRQQFCLISMQCSSCCCTCLGLL